MQIYSSREPRPEAMADVPGVCELPLTRAVVQYRDRNEIALEGGRIDDIGLALVVEGRIASSAEAVDLGSAALKVLDLSGELVVLGWVYEPTLEHMRRLVVTGATGDAEASAELRGYGLRLALRVLERIGFGPLTRSTFLRLGFRDLCRDLDLHEGTSVRLLMGAHRVARVHLDYDDNALIFRTPEPGPVRELEEALEEAFPADAIHALGPGAPEGAARAVHGASYQVRFGLPLSLPETTEEIDRIRTGLERLLQRFEPERFEVLEAHLEGIGRRRTLETLMRRGVWRTADERRRAAAPAQRTARGAVPQDPEERVH